MFDVFGSLTLAVQVAIGGTLLEGIRRRDPSVTVNAVLALVLAVLPTLAIGHLAGVGSTISLWVAVAGFLHCLGMLGLYESVTWWDHLTHTVSAALVAALLYAALLVSGADSGQPPLAVPAATLLLTVAIGVFWELVELVARDVGERFDVDPVLVHYGWRDTALDLGFDAFGALVVVLLDLSIFVPVLERTPALTRLVLLWSTGLVVVGSALAVLGIRTTG
ncbi:hypothetical protein ACFR97_06065 [Haloplanus litoreus]|uniref:Uncharacterized protein n=1 Tax=Haloplanus litoreus TaxID=767515 RepID=A0ABD6A038_9EURY